MLSTTSLLTSSQVITEMENVCIAQKKKDDMYYIKYSTQFFWILVYPLPSLPRAKCQEHCHYHSFLLIYISLSFCPLIFPPLSFCFSFQLYPKSWLLTIIHCCQQSLFLFCMIYFYTAWESKKDIYAKTTSVLFESSNWNIPEK